MLIQLLVNTILQEIFMQITLLFYNKIVELMKILYIVNIFFSDKIMESWGILYMYHSLVVGKIKEFICDNAFISY